MSHGTSAFHKLTAVISSQKGADKTHTENSHLTPENAVMFAVPWVIMAEDVMQNFDYPSPLTTSGERKKGNLCC